MKRIVSSLAIVAGVMATPFALADSIPFRATLSGPAAATANPSPGTGIATVSIDEDNRLITFNIPFQDLLGVTTAAHVHCCTAEPLMGSAPPATMTPSLIGFPLGTRSGLYQHSWGQTDPSTYSPQFLAANGGSAASAWEALRKGIMENQAYLNIHTTAYPAGEISGFLLPLPVTPVPEPSVFGMLALGLAGIGVLRRQRS